MLHFFAFFDDKKSFYPKIEILWQVNSKTIQLLIQPFVPYSHLSLDLCQQDKSCKFSFLAIFQQQQKKQVFHGQKRQKKNIPKLYIFWNVFIVCVFRVQIVLSPTIFNILEKAFFWLHFLLPITHFDISKIVQISSHANRKYPTVIPKIENRLVKFVHLWSSKCAEVTFCLVKQYYVWFPKVEKSSTYGRCHKFFLKFLNC